jgi:hypothetical protein
MAIIRGGKRIGGIDVRVGIPRDRTLENVENDPRLKQKAGSNPETTIGRYQAFVNEAEGFARKARYYVELNLPKGIPLGAFDLNGTVPSIIEEGSELSIAGNEQQATFRDQSDHLAIQQANAKRVQAFCSALQIPAREAIEKEIKHHGPTRKFIYDYKFDPINMTFYCDKFLRERSYFEVWQQAAFSTTSHNFNYYDNYVSDINIFQLGSYESRNERDDVTYAVKLFDCYPKILSPLDYSGETNEVQTFNVTLSYRYWINYFIDRSGNIELGESDFRDPTVKSKYGAFGSFLNKLPPELRRAGRDVLENLKRRIPIGGITGGRAFPPFGNFPPLNI